MKDKFKNDVIRLLGTAAYKKTMSQAANREKTIINNYSHACLEGNILYIYATDGRGFGIAAEGKKLGDIVN